MRAFSSAQTRKYMVEAGPHETDKLLLLQKNYTTDTNDSAAVNYFKELNR